MYILEEYVMIFKLGIHHNPKFAITLDCLPQPYGGENYCIECPENSINSLWTLVNKHLGDTYACTIILNTYSSP
jgi:hypothetical protein